MKITKSVLGIFTILATITTLSSFNTNPGNTEDHNISSEFQYTMCNSALNERFEYQFSGFIKKVIQVDVHFNEEDGYYYAVYNEDINGVNTVNYFQTTQEEVSTATYNYIPLSSASIGLKFAKHCKIDWSKADWCSPLHNGRICGIFTGGRCQ